MATQVIRIGPRGGKIAKENGTKKTYVSQSEILRTWGDANYHRHEGYNRSGAKTVHEHESAAEHHKQAAEKYEKISRALKDNQQHDGKFAHGHEEVAKTAAEHRERQKHHETESKKKWTIRKDVQWKGDDKGGHTADVEHGGKKYTVEARKSTPTDREHKRGESNHAYVVRDHSGGITTTAARGNAASVDDAKSKAHEELHRHLNRHAN